MTTDNGNRFSGEAEPTGDELVADYLRALEEEAVRLPWTARQELLEDVRSHIEVARAEADASVPDRVTVLRILGSLGDPVEIVDEAAVDEPKQAPPPRQDEVPPSNPYGAYGSPGYGQPSYGYPGYIHPESDDGPPYPLGALEVWALILLLFGGFAFGFGWFIGLLLLWTSDRWSRRDKLIGTLLPPGGLAGMLWLFTMPSESQTCAQPTSGMMTGSMHCTSSGWSLPSWFGIPAVLLLVALPFITAAYLRKRAARVRPANWGRFRTRRNGSGLFVAALLCAVVALGVVGAAAALFLGSSVGSDNNGPEPAMVSTSAVPPAQGPVSSGFPPTAPISASGR